MSGKKFCRVLQFSYKKVVHHKYTYKDGKKYGPYSYHTKRVDGKVVTTYLGHEGSSRRKKILVGGVALAVILALAVFFLFPHSPTGRISLDVSLKYKPGEKIDGDMKFRIKEGELIPKDSVVVISYGNQSKSFVLSDLVLDSPIEGDFYAEGKQLGGEGEGYGVLGRKIIYPEINFDMRVFSGTRDDIVDEVSGDSGEGAGGSDSGGSSSGDSGSGSSESSAGQNDSSSGSGDSGDGELNEGSQGDQNESGSGNGQEEQNNQDNGQGNGQGDGGNSGGGAGNDDETNNGQGNGNGAGNGGDNNGQGNGAGNDESGGNDEGDSGESDSGASEESGSSDSSSDSSESSSEGGVTGQVSSEDEYVTSGVVSHDALFQYNVEEGQNAEIVPSSVKVDGEQIPDGSIQLEQNGQQVDVTTNYYITREGFGEEFLGDYALTLTIPASALDLYAEPERLSISLVSGDQVLAESTEDVAVALGENKTVEPILTNASLVLLQEIPQIRIPVGGTGTIRLADYFEGAESYEFSVANVSSSFDGENLIITPDEGFKGSRRAVIFAISGEQRLESNEFNILVSSGAIKVTTSRDKIEVGKPVRWEKNVSTSAGEPINIELPAEAENISVISSAEAQVQVNPSISAGVISGKVTIELDIQKQPAFVRWIKRVIGAITGRVTEQTTGDVIVEEVVPSAGTDVALDGSADSYVIEYYTPAPEAFEEETEDGKIVTISAPDNVGYTDVIASSSIDNSLGVSSAEVIKLYWRVPSAVAGNVAADVKEVGEVPEHEVVEESEENATVSADIVQGAVEPPMISTENDSTLNDSIGLTGQVVDEFGNEIVSDVVNEVQQSPIQQLEVSGPETRIEVPFDSYDLDEDGAIDYIEWVVPHLSNQTYEIILITDAQHLDENRTVISDITGEVKYLDGNWSETISDGHYVRVTYEVNLTNGRDITVYPRTVSGSPRIDVYERNGSSVIASFNSLTDNQYNKVILTSLPQPQDTFDLRVLGGSVEFDQIVDPLDTTMPNITFVGQTPADGSSQTANAIFVNVSSAEETGDHYVLTNFDNSLILWYRMDDVNGSRDPIDLSSRGNNGSLVSGGNTTTSPSPTGTIMYNSTLMINQLGAAGAAHLKVPNFNLSLIAPTEWTIAFWIWHNQTVPSADFAHIFTTEDGNARGIAMYLINGQTRYYVDIKNASGGNGGVVAEGTGAYTTYANAWTHYAIVWKNSSYLSLYRNGVNISHVAFYNLTPSANNVLRIGTRNTAQSDYNQYFLLDEFSVFNRSLMTQEVGSLYNATSNSYYKNFTGLSTGAHSFVSYAVDVAANKNSTGSRTATIDTTSPVANLQAPANGTTVTSAAQSFNATFTDNVQLANATFHLWNASGDVINSSTRFLSGTAGGVNLSVSLPAAGGTFFWNYQVVDNASNSVFNDTNYTITYSADSGPPGVTIVSPVNRTYTFNEIPLVFNVTLSEVGSVTYSLDNGVTNITMSGANTTNFNATNISIATGTYVFRVYANDSLDNWNRTTSRVFSVNTTLLSGCASLTSADTVYTLNQSVNVTTHCMQVQASGITIFGNSFNLTDDSAASADNIGINATGYASLIVKNISIVGFNRSIVADGLTTSQTAPRVEIYDSAVKSVHAEGFNNVSSGSGGAGGYIYMSNSNFSSTISVKGGNGTGVAGAGETGAIEFAGAFVNLSARSVIVQRGLSNGVALTYKGNLTVNYSSGFEAIKTYYGRSDLDYFKIINRTGGEIRFGPHSVDDGETVTQSTMNISYNISNHVIIRTNFAYLNSSAASNLNLSSSVTFYGMPANFAAPAIFRGGSTCASNICANSTSLNASTVVFNVTNWDYNYTIAESDSVVPSAQYVVPTENNASYLARSNVMINVTGSDANLANITIELFNSTSLINMTTTTTSPNYVNITVPRDGAYTFNATSSDTSNNKNNTGLYTIIVDTLLPGVSFVSPTPSDGSNQSGDAIYVNVSNSDAQDYYTTTDLDKSNILWMRMDDLNSSNDPIDLSSWGNNGTNKGNAAQNSSGYFGSSFGFDGNGDYVSIAPMPNFVSTQNYTYSAWVKVNVKGTNTILAQNFLNTGAEGTGYGFSLEVNSTNYVAFNRYYLNQGPGVGAKTAVVVSTNVLTSGQWYFITATYVSGNVTLYVDGVSKGNGFSAAFVNYSGSGAEAIGAAHPLGSYFNGLIDDVLVSNRTLSTVEINSLYNSSANKYSNNFTSLASGAHTFIASTVDRAANKNNTGVRTVTIDGAPPVVTINSPTGNVTVSQVVFNVTTSEDADAAILTLNNGVTNVTMQKNGQRDFNYTNSSIADGTYTVRFHVNDTTGNTNSSANRTFTVDTIKPTITISSPTNTSYTDTNITINFTSSDTNGISTRWFYNETGNTTYTGVTSNVVGQGSHTFIFYSNDSLGNLNSTSLTFSVDSLVPGVSYASPTENNASYLARANVMINATASDTNLANVTIELFNSTGLFNRTTVTTSPNFVNVSSLTDGVYTFNASARDVVNSVNYTDTRTITVDTIVPAVSLMAPANNTLASTGSHSFNATFTDTNLANATFYLWNSSGDLINTTLRGLSGATGSVNLTVSLPYEGSFKWNYRVGDNASNYAFNNTNYTITYDAANPSAQYVSPTETAGSYISRANIMINVTGSDTNLQAVAVRLFNSSTLLNTTITSSSPNYVNISVPRDGIYYFNATSNDSVGNVNNTQTRNVTVDRTVPLIVFYGNTHANGTLTANNLPTIQVNVTDTNFANLTVSIYNSTGAYSVETSTNNPYSISYLDPFPDGIYYLNASTLDKALNLNYTETRTFTIDTAVPGVTIVMPTNTTYSSLPLNFNVSLSENGGTVFYTLDNGVTNLTMSSTDGRYYNASNSSIADGTYTFRLYANDSAGNRNDTTRVVFSVDRTAPSVTITSPANSSYTSTNITINFTSSDNGGIANRTFFNESANVSYTGVTSVVVSEGSHRFIFYSSDNAGNSNTTSLSFFVDSLVPSINFTSPTQSTGVYLSRNYIEANVTSTDTNLANITLRFYNSSRDLIRTNVSTTSPLYVNYSGLSNGVYYYNATSIDTANNVNNSVTRNITLDTINPAAAIVVPTNASYNTVQTELNYTASDANLATCLYSTDGGELQIEVACGTNISSLTSSQGNNVWQVIVSDSAGNSNTSSLSFFVDSLVPGVSYASPTESNVSYLARANVMINATASDTNLANITIELFNSTGLFNRTTVTSSPNFVNVSSLTDGVYTFNASARDVTNNVNYTDRRTITIDTLNPALQYVSNTDSDGSIKSTNTINVNVTSSDTNLANITIRLYNASRSEIRNNLSASSPFNISYAGLSDGVYYFNATAIDLANNINNSATRNVTIDSAAPGVTIVVPANTTYSSLPLNFNVSLSENGGTVFYTLDNGVTNLTMSSTDNRYYNASNSSIADGTYTFRLYAHDSASNRNDTTRTVFSVDRTAPSVTITSPANTSYTSTNITINFTSSDTSGISTRWFYNETGNTTYTGETSNVVGQGSHTFIFYSNDSLGNLNSTSLTFSVDSLVPSLSYVSPTPDTGAYVNNGIITINVTASDTNLANITIRLYNASRNEIRSNVSASSPFNISYAGLSDGVYYFNATAADILNNRNDSSSRSVVLDSVAPTLTISSPEEQRSYSGTSISFTVGGNEDLASCNYTLNGGIVNYTMTGSADELTATNSSIADGSYSAIFYCWDNAGNQGSNNVNFIVDNVAPVVTINSPSGNLSVSQVTFNVTTTDNAQAARFTLNAGATNVTMQINGLRNFNYTNSSIADGTYVVRFFVNDSAGNLNSSANRTFTVDTVKPTITVTSPTNTTYASTNITISFTSSDSGTGVNTRWFYNGSTNITYTGETSNVVGQGSHTFIFYSNDSLDNLNSTSLTFSVDSLVPGVSYASPTENNASYLARANVMINATASDTNLANVTIELFNSTGLFNRTTVTTSPNFVNVSSLTDGVYTFNASARDVVNSVNYTDTRTITVDTTNPGLQYVSPTASSGNYSANAIAVNVTFSDVNLGTATVRLFNSSHNQINSSSSSSSSLYINFTGLAEGTYHVNASVNDSAGNVNSTVTRTYGLDRANPGISYVSPTLSSESYRNADAVAVNVTATDTNLANITILLFNSSSQVTSAFNTSSPNYANFTSLAEGIYYYNASAIDLALNINYTSTRNITLDRTFPSTTFTGGTPANNTFSASGSPAFQITASDTNLANITFELFNSSGVVTSGSSTSSPLSVSPESIDNGVYFFNGSSVDLANNRNNTETRTLTIDTIRPGIVFRSPTPANGSYSSSTSVTINVTGNETNRGTGLIDLDGTNYTMTCSGTTSYTCNYTFSGLGAGSHTILAYMNDSVGNYNVTEQRTFIIDATRPGLEFGVGSEDSGETVANLSIYTNVSLSETNLANISFSLYNKTGGLVNRTNFSSAVLSVNWTAELPAGTYRYEVNATDLANNVNGTPLRTLIVVPSCLASCSEGNACSLAHTSCYLHSGMCSGGVCDFTNLSMQNTTMYTLYNASGDGNSLVINISSNLSNSVFFSRPASTFVFSGKNGTTLSGGSSGGNGGVINITTLGLFNRTNSRFIGLGGYSSVSGRGGNGGSLQITYHGLIGVSFNLTNYTAGSSSNNTAGSAGATTRVKDVRCPLDVDAVDNGIVDGTDVDTLRELYYGNLSIDATYNSTFDINCDNRIDVIDISRIGFQYARV